MEAPMRVGWGAWKASLFVAGCLLLDAPGEFMPKKASGSASADATRAGPGATKPVTWKPRGRPDMAIQIWQQILLSDPEQR